MYNYKYDKKKIIWQQSVISLPKSFSYLTVLPVTNETMCLGHFVYRLSYDIMSILSISTTELMN